MKAKYHWQTDRFTYQEISKTVHLDLEFCKDISFCRRSLRTNLKDILWIKKKPVLIGDSYTGVGG